MNTIMPSDGEPWRGRCQPHVVVIDDEPSIVEVISELLGDEGCRVTALSAPLPSADIGHLKPDVVILDLLFSGNLLGPELVQRLRQDPATATVPIIVCTALSTWPGSENFSDTDPSIQLIRKPFDLDLVVTAVLDLTRSAASC